MRRVVVTGMGIWSCIGQDLQSTTTNLIRGFSGIIYNHQRIKYGLQSGLVGNVQRPMIKALLPRKDRVLMSIEAEYAYMATAQALIQAKITEPYLHKNEIGIIFGSDGNPEIINQIYNFEQKKESEFDMYAWIRSETSNVNIALSSIFQFKGVSYCVGAACASGSHAIGIATTLIRSGTEDMIVVGGACEIEKENGSVVDVLGATSLRNSDPIHASRPFDRDRDGMVPSGGAAALVLEEYEHAKARGANILAEVCGYGFSSNGIEDISAPSADAEYIAMKRALDDAGIKPEEVDYVNAHGTSTIAGDIEEAKALTQLFAAKSKGQVEKTPWISSTKSMTGHENWMAGASEAVYSILMMQNNFVAPNINLENVIDEAKDLNIARKTIYTPINIVLSNSSGMGGTNSALVFRRIQQ